MKFRVWDPEVEKIHYNRDITFFSNRKWEAVATSLNKDGSMFFAKTLWEGDGAALMQSTGVMDKNGKEIWEGDILKDSWNEYMDGKPILSVVKFGKFVCEDGYGASGSGFYLKRIDSDLKYLGEFDNQIVVGNIYENPELLGGEKCIK